MTNLSADEPSGKVLSRSAYYAALQLSLHPALHIIKALVRQCPDPTAVRDTERLVKVLSREHEALNDIRARAERKERAAEGAR